MLPPYVFPWPRSGPPSFFILESPLNVLNIQWYPVDNHRAVTTTLPMLPHVNALTFISLTRPPWYPDRAHSPAVTKLLI